MPDTSVDVENSVCAFLNALFAVCLDDPITLEQGATDDGDVIVAEVSTAEEIAAFVEAAGTAPVYVRPVAGGRVAFLHDVSEGVHDPQEWEGDTLRPTAVLYQGDRMMLRLYALDTPTEPTDETARLISAMGGHPEDMIPLPGSNGWRLVHSDAQAFHTLDALVAIYDDALAAPATVTGDHGTLNDAKLMTPFDPDDPTYAQEMVISIGAGRESAKWVPKPMSVALFVDMLSKHREEAKKDGLAFVLAEIVGSNRRKIAVKSCYGVGLDIDVGVPGAEIDAALAAMGCLAVRYTTHSHGKTSTQFRKDRLIKYADEVGGDIEDPATITRFLREKEKWEPALVASAEYVGDEHQPEGLMAQINHDPMPKHRVVVPFAAPFNITEVAKTQDEGMKLWNLLPKALARDLGDLPLDKAALDPSRLFYFPRHAAGKPHETTIFGGTLFDWTTLNLDDTPEDAFEAALEQEIERKSGKSRSTTKEGQALGRWSMKAAHGFQIVDVIRDHDPDRIRTNGATKIDIECPFDDEHSNPGDPEDRGCFAVNAGDGPSEIFTIKCAHDSCQEFTNLDMTGKMIKDGWFPAPVLEDPNYNTLDEYEAERAEAERRAGERREQACATYKDAIAALTKDSPEEEAQRVARLIAEAGLSPFAEEDALNGMKTNLGRKTVKPLQAMLKAAKTALAEEAEAAEVEPSSGRYAGLAQDIPLPSREYGSYSYRPFAGRPWVHSQDTRLWTPWAIVGAVTYPDRDGVDGLKVRVERVGEAIVEFDLPADVTTDSGRMKATLRSRGVGMTGDGMERLTGLAAQITPDEPTKAFGWGGWREPGTFLTPWGHAIGQDPNLSVAAEARPKGDEVGGTFEGWRDGTDAAFQTGLRQLQISACASYASPIIDLCRSTLTSGVLFLSGAAEAGKTTAHKVQTSAWGDPSPRRGLLGSLDVSAQAPEVLLAQASGAGGAFDEAKHYKGSLQDLIFRISGDTGRARMRQDTSGLRDGRAWRLLVCMSYERTVEHRIRVEDGEDVFGGLGARCLEVPADLTKLTREAMAPVDAIKTHFGHGGTRFVQALVDLGYATDPGKLESEVEALADTLLQDTHTDQRRAARLMAAIWRAGQIAQDVGLIPRKFPLEPPVEFRLSPPKDASGDKVPEGADGTAPDDTVLEIGDGKPLPEGLDSLGRMIVTAWRLSREMDSASTDPTAKAVKALLRNLAMGRGVVDHGDAARQDTHAVRLHKFDSTGEAVFVIPNATLPAMLDGSADPGAVRKALRNNGLLILHKHDRGKRMVEETTWGHVPGFGPGPAIVIPVAKVQGS